MTVEELIKKELFKVVVEGDDLSREVTGIFCCDLLSIAMGRAPSDSAWVTVMGNVNTIAVARGHSPMTCAGPGQSSRE